MKNCTWGGIGGGSDISSSKSVQFTLTIHCEDKTELISYAKAIDYQLFVDEFREKLRYYRKYGLPDKIDSTSELMDDLWDKFHEMAADYNILVGKESY